MLKTPVKISIANQKGGVGKTTSVANLAAALAAKGKNVLAIDCDYQANLTTLLCGDEQIKNQARSLTESIKKDLSLKDVVVTSKIKNVDVVAANRELDDLREQMVGQPKQFRLVDFMLDCPSVKKYDYILLDTHPSLDCFFQSAIAASDFFLIPLFPEADSSRGLAHQLNAIEKVRRYLNPKLVFMGSLIVKYDRYNATHKVFEQLIRKFCADNNFFIFKTNIPNSQSVAAAAAHGLSLRDYKKGSPISKAYDAFAKEFINACALSPKHKNSKKSYDDLELAADL